MYPVRSSGHRIRSVHLVRTHVFCSVADPGCLSQIPDPTFFHPGSRIRTVSIPDPGSASKNLSILTPKKQKKWFLSSRKYDPGCSSRIRIRNTVFNARSILFHRKVAFHFDLFDFLLHFVLYPDPNPVPEPDS